MHCRYGEHHSLPLAWSLGHGSYTQVSAPSPDGCSSTPSPLLSSVSCPQETCIIVPRCKVAFDIGEGLAQGAGGPALLDLLAMRISGGGACTFRTCRAVAITEALCLQGVFSCSPVRTPKVNGRSWIVRCSGTWR